jgi:multicomponent Na+:H+ antiporter subunit D
MTTAPWIALPAVLPLLAAALSVVVGRSRATQRAIGLGTLVVIAGICIRIVVEADRHDVLVTQSGGWAAPLGITLRADRFSAIMLLVAVGMFLAVLVYAIGQGDEERRHVGFHPVYLTLVAGVNMAFLTADLFNLFVAFEVFLVSSYVLLTLGGRFAQVRAGTTYVVISLLASITFLFALGLLYRAVGTVNLVDLPEAMGQLDPSMQRVFLLLFLASFGIKAAIFPLFFWLPDSYPNAPTAITAVFAGLLTKVGVYAMFRIQTSIGPDDTVVGTILLVVAGLTMVIGVFGAVSQQEIKRILSFHAVSQIGYMIFGLGLLTVAGLAAAILYISQYIIVKTTLFLTGGLVERAAGTGHLQRVDGMLRTSPLLGMLFLLPALSLAGVPPFSGFVGKFALVDAGIDASSWTIVAVSLAVSIMTLLSMNKIWAGAFLGEPTANAVVEDRLPIGMVASTAALVAASIVFAFAAGPIYGYVERAAETLLATGVAS